MSQPKDSFGREVNVGDYLVFTAKGKYIHSLSLGLVTKITPKGYVSLTAICTHGRTMEEARLAAEKRSAELRASHPHLDDEWHAKYVMNHAEPYKTTLQSASSCVKVEGFTLDVALTQALA